MLTEEGHSETFYKIEAAATSDDGISWTKYNENIVDSVLENECQAEADVFQSWQWLSMYFSYRYGLEYTNNDPWSTESAAVRRYCFLAKIRR